MKYITESRREDGFSQLGPTIEAESWESAQAQAKYLSSIAQDINPATPFLQVIAEKSDLPMIAIEVYFDDGNTFTIHTQAESSNDAMMLALIQCNKANLTVARLALSTEAVEPPELW